MSAPQRLAVWSVAIAGVGAAGAWTLEWAVQRYAMPLLQSVLQYQEEMRDELARELGRAPTDAEYQAYVSARSDEALADLGMTSPQRRPGRR